MNNCSKFDKKDFNLSFIAINLVSSLLNLKPLSHRKRQFELDLNCIHTTIFTVVILRCSTHERLISRYSLLSLCLEATYLLLEGRLYQQVHGTVVGSLV